jgi:hypothetical protein
MARNRENCPLRIQNDKIYKNLKTGKVLIMTMITFFGVPTFLNTTLNGVFNKTKLISSKVAKFSVDTWGFSVSASYEAVEAIVDASTDVLTGQGDNETETATGVLNSTLEKMGRGGAINVNEKTLAISSAVVVERGLKILPPLLCGACPNLLY